MNKVIDELKSKLDAISDKGSLTSEDLKFLEETLYNKWYGVQVIASKVLAKHHPPEASALLKDWFLLHMDDFHMSSMAYRALVPCLLASDIAWILELYFKHPVSDNIPYLYQKGYLCYFLLGHALSRFVGQEAEEAIELLLLASESEDNAYHIRVLSEVHKSQRTRVRKALIDNPNVPNKQVVKDWFRLRGSETFRFKT